MSVAVVAEKPSVARDLARVLGAEKRGEGYLHGNGWVVTWAIGHLVALAEPGEMRPEWKKWRRDQLPILPREWPLVVSEGTAAQFAVVQKILNSPQISDVVCATDAGREGELIFRYVYEAAGCDKPFRRLWISSLTPEAIRRGFAGLRDGRDMDPLADAARGRSRADWLVGMNLSRACSLAFDEDLSVGRVQTPTLAMVVERELAIRAFVPEDYLEVEATFAPPELPPAGEESAAPTAGAYKGTWFRGEAPERAAKRLPAEGDEARRIVARALSAPAGATAVESVAAERKRMPPPLLYDLTELQRHANRLFGWTAQKTLGLAQTLYERWKILSYPRTDSRHLSGDVAATLPEIVAAIRGPYEAELAPDTGLRELGRRFVDDAKVTDHHAILPTTARAAGLDLSADERTLYDLVCRRLLAAWHGDHVWGVTTVITAIRTPADPALDSEASVDRFHSVGTAIEEMGWKVLDLAPRGGEPKAPRAPRPAGDGDEPGEDTSQDLPSGLAAGLVRRVAAAEALAKRTRPPRRLTEGTLLTAMETAGKALDDKELSAAMRESGLGTPATRAETIETLLRRLYIERQGKALAATEKGIRLIEVVHPQVKSPEMTGRWEAELKRIERREKDLPTFLEEIETYVRDVVGGTFTQSQLAFPPKDPSPSPPSPPSSPSSSSSSGVGGRPAAGVSAAGGAAWRDPVSARSGPRSSDTARPSSVSTDTGNHAVTGPAAGPLFSSRTAAVPSPAPPPPPRPSRTPVSVDHLEDLLRNPFNLPSFRPFQEAVCRAVTGGQDVLLVMPTGAGKSLCYQLPGLARGGTTLVVSPLIALMEDQVAKLRELGLHAERIHSGRERSESRQVARDYLDGLIDYLFIAPERLAVPGFPELLARRKPVLVAIDEAHCISQWGHDFRPEYRMLGERLPILRPAPVIALTATATPRVQDDIVSQLGLAAAGRFIHGFRRTNIAVEVSEAKPSARRAAVATLLADPARRPAIIYAPTRKEADALGAELAGGMSAAAYHAGMTGAVRDRVQADFLAGRLEVIVATIAFGMGIDKANVRTVIHTGLPGSLEGYYQEIGRAGRDGLPSRAILLYSFADRRNHEFFHDRDYPEPADLARIYNALTEAPQTPGELRRRAKLDEEIFAKALEKLWIHGGAVLDPEENAVRGRPGWQTSYVAQREHKLAQLADITRYAESHGCRMLHLVEHFGDREDSGEPCGLCDVCAADDCAVRRFRDASAEELGVARRLLVALRQRDGQSTGQLFREIGGAPDARRAFERLLGALAGAGLLTVASDEFEKEGRTIHFQRATLTAEALRGELAALDGLRLPEDPASAPRQRLRKGKKTAAAPSAGRGRAARPAGQDGAAADGEAPPALVAALKAWRLAEARRSRLPAFRILTDRTLLGLAAARPAGEEDLLAVSGFGPTLARKYGAEILAIVAQSG